MANSGEPAHLRVLQAEIDRLQNAVGHLVQSNKELQAAIDEEGDDDRTFKTAIEDNIVTIAKYRAQTERLERELRELRAGRHTLGGEAISTDAAATAAAKGPAAIAGPTQQQGQQGPSSAAASGQLDTAMAEAQDQQAAGQQAQQPGGGGMWM